MDQQPPRPDAAERTERHLRAVAELADDAMQLARHAARKALRQAEAEAAGLPLPPVPRPTGPAGLAGPDLVADFCRMSREVCRLIVLEARLAGQWSDADRDRRRERRTQARRARVRRALHGAVVVEPGGPDRETVLQTIEDALEDDEVEGLMADGALLGDVVVEVCRSFSLRVDESRLPPEALHTTRILPFACRASGEAVALMETETETETEAGPDPP